MRRLWSWLTRRAAPPRPEPPLIIVHQGERQYVRDADGWRRVRPGDVERWREEGLL